MAGECEKPRPGATSIHHVILGRIYVCIEKDCNAVRKVWSDGTKDIVDIMK